MEKAWVGDADNGYNTRPQAGRTGYQWRTALVLQRSLDGGQDLDQSDRRRRSGLCGGALRQGG